MRPTDYEKKLLYAKEYKRRVYNDPLYRQKIRAYRAKNRKILNAKQMERHRKRMATDAAYRKKVRGYAIAAYAKLKASMTPYDRRARTLRKHGITPTQYDEILSAQGGVCAIGKERPAKSGGSRLVVDHDHTTGKVRGLLCFHCNTGLGHLRDDPERLAAAIAYLQGHATSNF